MGQEVTKEKKNWKKGWWWKLPVGTIGLLGLIGSVLDAGSSTQTADALPTCDSKEAQDMVAQSLKGNGVEVIALKNVMQSPVHVSTEDNVFCTAMLMSNKGKFGILFTFEWVDKAKGAYYGQVQEL